MDKPVIILKVKDGIDKEELREHIALFQGANVIVADNSKIDAILVVGCEAQYFDLTK